MTNTSNTGAYFRFMAMRDASSRQPKKFDKPAGETRTSDFFGSNTFNANMMKARLSKSIFQRLQNTIESGASLEKDVADAAASAMRDWAIEKGATHFCHWFQPQTGLTAEKHDAFLSLENMKVPVESFSGSQLIQSEPDASSFPSGGMRTTFEARGYTVWDPSSPAFIVDSVNGKTLCIPSAFISYHGHALDEKTALLRSVESLSERATNLLHMLGEEKVKRVVPTLGIEQEYFLIDRAFHSLRPDLVMAGRTLLGGQPPKGQQLEDHYFGSIPPRVLAYMNEVEHELYKLGVPVKTRHNEVAVSQFETAPIFEEVNLAIDHNQLTMETLRKVAKRHDFECILHEKPFAGLNGSGKHCNWALMVTSSASSIDGMNLLEPGKTPEQNLRFLAFMTAVIAGVHKHAGLLRGGIASAGNDHRLGANEAPPAIISIFLGDTLTQILDAIEKGTTHDDSAADRLLALGVQKLPKIQKDNTDRNRTSPFAFTGNKFEFRAVGSSSSPAFPVTLLNAAVADGIQELCALIESNRAKTKSREAAILTAIQEVVKKTKAIRFDGNGYSEEWVREAEKRGIPNLRKTPEALAQIVSVESKKLLTSLKILSEAEIDSRFNVRIERYIKNLFIEIDMLKSMVDTHVLPTSFAFHRSLCESVTQAKAAGAPSPQMETLTRVSALIQDLQTKRTAFDHLVQKCESQHDEFEKSKLLAYEVVDAMKGLRSVCDELEGVVSDDVWPLPKYREMLFLS